MLAISPYPQPSNGYHPTNGYAYARAIRRADPHVFRGLGAAETAADVIVPPMSPAAVFWSLVSLAGTGASAYHGYKRNNSIGWAIVWGLLGGLVPVITVPVAIAQGYGKRKG